MKRILKHKILFLTTVAAMLLLLFFVFFKPLTAQAFFIPDQTQTLAQSKTQNQAQNQSKQKQNPKIPAPRPTPLPPMPNLSEKGSTKAFLNPPYTNSSAQAKTKKSGLSLFKNKKDTEKPPQKIDKNKECTKLIQIALTFEGNKYLYIDQKIVPTNHLVAHEIHSFSINGTYSQKKQIMIKCVTAGGTHKAALLHTMPLLAQTVDKAIAAVNLDPVDSKIKFDPDHNPKFKITDEKQGRFICENQIYREIYFNLLLKPDIKIELKPTAINPAITSKDNQSLTNLKSKYQTDFDSSGENRKQNIKLALKKVNGTVLLPNEEFSFNQIVGDRTAANGFKEGNIIVGGKYKKGTGGGVCQVSTTVYNAALLADLKVTKVKNHSLVCA
ncbi:MAG: VanW family protein, partial [Firmicutes bacterium]|nr:VanW family protein [Bacillota bacterium]